MCAALLAVVLSDITATAPLYRDGQRSGQLRVPDGALSGDRPRHPGGLTGGGPHAVYLLDAFNAAPICLSRQCRSLLVLPCAPKNLISGEVRYRAVIPADSQSLKVNERKPLSTHRWAPLA
jgi:hypothetical protein